MRSRKMRVRPTTTGIHPARTAAGMALAVLVILSTGCLDETPLDPASRIGAFTLLGGLDPGQAMALQGEDAEQVFLPGGSEGAEFVLVPFFGTEQAGSQVSVELRGGELVDVVGPPRSGSGPSDGISGGTAGTDGDTPGLELLAGAPAFPGTGPFHRRLRRAEIRQLEPELRNASWRANPVTRAQRASTADSHVPEPGDTISLRTLNPAESNLCANPLERGGRVVAVTPDVILVSDTASPAELTDEQLQTIADEFGSLVRPVAVEHFGAPTDIDQNDRVTVFFTPVVNELEAGGFTFTGDLFPVEECAASNEGEIFFILSPDPAGTTPIDASAELVAQLATGIIGHEFQHLINAGRRIYVNGANQLEAVWMNEGLSHIAEELLFYEATRFEPGQNISLDSLLSSSAIAQAADRFATSNLFFYASFAAAPEDATFLGSDNAATRGVGWSFLRYAADQEGASDAQLFFDLVNTTSSGFDNLNRVLESGRAADLLQAWTASVFADDAVDGAPSFLTQPSWHHRSLLPLFTDSGDFPLAIEELQGPGPVQVLLTGGGSAFFRVRVPAGGVGEFTIDAAGTPTDALRVSVVRAE